MSSRVVSSKSWETWFSVSCIAGFAGKLDRLAFLSVTALEKESWLHEKFQFKCTYPLESLDFEGNLEIPIDLYTLALEVNFWMMIQKGSHKLGIATKYPQKILPMH